MARPLTLEGKKQRDTGKGVRGRMDIVVLVSEWIRQCMCFFPQKKNSTN
jgi:hypothetical protein